MRNGENRRRACRGNEVTTKSKVNNLGFCRLYPLVQRVGAETPKKDRHDASTRSYQTALSSSSLGTLTAGFRYSIIYGLPLREHLRCSRIPATGFLISICPRIALAYRLRSFLAQRRPRRGNNRKNCDGQILFPIEGRLVDPRILANLLEPRIRRNIRSPLRGILGPAEFSQLYMSNEKVRSVPWSKLQVPLANG